MCVVRCSVGSRGGSGVGSGVRSSAAHPVVAAGVRGRGRGTSSFPGEVRESDLSPPPRRPQTSSPLPPPLRPSPSCAIPCAKSGVAARAASAAAPEIYRRCPAAAAGGAAEGGAGGGHWAGLTPDYSRGRRPVTPRPRVVVPGGARAGGALLVPVGASRRGRRGRGQGRRRAAATAPAPIMRVSGRSLN